MARVVMQILYTRWICIVFYARACIHCSNEFLKNKNVDKSISPYPANDFFLVPCITENVFIE